MSECNCTLKYALQAVIEMFRKKRHFQKNNNSKQICIGFCGEANGKSGEKIRQSKRKEESNETKEKKSRILNYVEEQR